MNGSQVIVFIVVMLKRKQQGAISKQLLQALLQHLQVVPIHASDLQGQLHRGVNIRLTVTKCTESQQATLHMNECA